MTPGEIAYLSLVVGAACALLVTLAKVSSEAKSW